MLGYRARVAAGLARSRPDGEEISEAALVHPRRDARRLEDGSVRIPPPVSIARRLIEHWYGAELPGTWSRP